MATALAVQAPATGEIAPLKRGGWLLIAAFLTFVASVVFMVAAGGDYDRELMAAAEAAGTPLNAVPVAEQARLAVRHSTVFVTLGILLFIPFGTFFAGLHALDSGLRATAGAALSRAAWWLGLGMTAIFYTYNILSFGLLAGPDNPPPLVRNLDVITIPLAAFFTTLGLGAVICAGLAARQARVAPRTGAGAAIVAGLFALLGIALFIGSGFTDNLPPLAPFPAALILAIGLVRTKEA